MTFLAGTFHKRSDILKNYSCIVDDLYCKCTNLAIVSFPLRFLFIYSLCTLNSKQSSVITDLFHYLFSNRLHMWARLPSERLVVHAEWYRDSALIIRQQQFKTGMFKQSANALTTFECLRPSACYIAYEILNCNSSCTRSYAKIKLESAISTTPTRNGK